MPRISFFIFCLMFFTVSFGVAAMAAVVPSIALYFGVEANYALRLTWLYMLPYGVVALIWGPLTRVVKIKKLFLFTTFGFFLSAIFFSLSQTIQQAFVFRFLMGCFGCSFVPLSLITIGKEVEPKDKGKYIGIFFGISYISTSVGVFLSGFLPWRMIYSIPAILSLAVFILVATHLHDFDFRKTHFKISYLDTLKDKKCAYFFLVIILASFLYHSLQQRLGVYLSQTFSLRQLVISSIFTISTISAIIFEFTGGFFSHRFGNIRIARVGFIGMSIFALLLLLINKYQAIFFIIVLWGAGWALTHIGLSAHLTHFPDSILRDASSLNSSLRFSFGGLGAFAGGLIASSAAGFKVLFVIVAIGVFLLGFYLKKMLAERKECYG